MRDYEIQAGAQGTAYLIYFVKGYPPRTLGTRASIYLRSEVKSVFENFQKMGS